MSMQTLRVLFLPIRSEYSMDTPLYPVVLNTETGKCIYGEKTVDTPNEAEAFVLGFELAKMIDHHGGHSALLSIIGERDAEEGDAEEG